MPLPTIKPCLPVFRKDFPLNKEGFTYSVKYDGYRAILYKDHKDLYLWTRQDNLLNVSKDFLSKLQEYLAKYDTLILDGELIAVDSEHPTGNFQALQNRLNTPCLLQYRCFDVCYVNGKDVRTATLQQRLEFIKRLGINEVHFRTVKHEPDVEALNLSQYSNPNNPGKPAIEGLVAKQLASRYEGDKQLSWIKIKERETKIFLCVNVANGSGRLANTVGSLDLCDVNMRDIGSVGSGLTDDQREKIRIRVEEEMGEAFEPFGVEVIYQRWTTDRKLVMPIFVRIIELTDDTKIDAAP